VSQAVFIKISIVEKIATVLQLSAEADDARTSDHHAQRTTPLPACELATPENSPSKVAAADKPFFNFISTDAVVSADLCAYAAPLTTKDTPYSAWKVAAIERSGS
jgi:hypothetical protein